VPMPFGYHKFIPHEYPMLQIKNMHIINVEWLIESSNKNFSQREHMVLLWLLDRI